MTKDTRTLGAAFFAGSRPRIIGHRGSAETTPENTLESFREGVEFGAQILELDVHMSSDGEVIVCHDDTVDRTTNGTGKISNLSLSQLKELDAGYHFKTQGVSGFPLRNKGVKLPTLEEVLKEFALTPLCIEFKAFDRKLIDAVVTLLHRYSRIERGSSVCCSFNHKVVTTLRRIEPGIITNFSRREVARMLLRSFLPVFRRRAKQHSAVFQVQWKRNGRTLVTRRVVKTLHKLGYEVHVWTVNDEESMHRLIKLGVDGIFTDNPGLLRRVLNR